MTKRQGRPPKGNEAMMTPITIRLPRAIHEHVETMMAKRMDAPDKATVIRELLVAGIKATSKAR